MRLRPLTEKIPKSMVPINSEPLIVHQIRWLKQAGIREIAINVHHLKDQIVESLGTGKQFGVEIHYSEEQELLETGGGIVQVLPFFENHPFIVLNGDIWTNYRFRALSTQTTEYAHLIVRPLLNSSEVGDFELHGSMVKRHHEMTQHNCIFCGISLLNPKIFGSQHKGRFSLTKNLLFQLADEGKVTGEYFSGLWGDIGSPEGLKRVRKFTM